jgi:hypothetical protein
MFRFWRARWVFITNQSLEQNRAYILNAVNTFMSIKNGLKSY